ncbi:1,2-dihydroxy-3-keto-5-methylthiopentene dioxygenase [Microthyrium microscopicum]|uniref:Acireductone dioxygenase n=1 Tax=Microthyrium microscopicum TaxID=703497 RepID=A0A6A6UCH9_9PEZI|nr:1,2-dihydroxy-3-keto-5-methylthiopentene dioxygenase [Microthyrium microscopicum]
MRAYWFDNNSGDQRLPHDSGRDVSEEYLEKLGIKHFNYPSVDDVDKLAANRGYKNRDVITISPTSMGEAYEEKVKMFFNEHLHEDEEIRYILDGGGFFDVRDKNDEWVRIKLAKYDLMIMPAGIYHRFTTDEQNYTKAMRLFQDDPKWTPLTRGPETDGNEFRKEYVHEILSA